MVSLDSLHYRPRYNTSKSHKSAKGQLAEVRQSDEPLSCIQRCLNDKPRLQHETHRNNRPRHAFKYTRLTNLAFKTRLVQNNQCKFALPLRIGRLRLNKIMNLVEKTNLSFNLRLALLQRNIQGSKTRFDPDDKSVLGTKFVRLTNPA